ncbi:hypothetical protein TH66_03150 [Carbonactinospora thermoautotrophica]|nr:hypothetical protein [Carbonactinospora thermoautotrophica]KWX00783.1 hypothetical protein LI90_1806 [Carbonactinospora thermoautotrophica]KWX05265.1 hypothetical protein TH66_03150 [Carbonactinospora thermoautotrophica]
MLNGSGTVPAQQQAPPRPPTLEEYLQQIRAGAHIQNPTLGDLLAYKQWTSLFAGLVANLLETHPQIRPSVEAHARSWGWRG